MDQLDLEASKLQPTQSAGKHKFVANSQEKHATDVKHTKKLPAEVSAGKHATGSKQ